MSLDVAAIRNHAQLVLHHVTKAEGIRDAGGDDAGEMAEAKRHLIEVANAFEMFCDPMDEPHSADGADTAATAPAN